VGIREWICRMTKRASAERLSDAADKNAELLLIRCHDFRPSFFEALVGDNSSALTDEVAARGWAEMLVFAFHLTDRIALRQLGNEQRAAYMDDLFEAVGRRSDATLACSLRELYNERLLFFQSCKMPSGKQSANLKGTLFWEFAKLMASPCHYADPVYANWNPVSTVKVGIWAMELWVAVVDVFDDAFKLANIRN
jgi:hypothetical protein